MRLTILRLEAHLLYLCAHAVLQHGLADLKLIRYFDLHQIITADSLDWDFVVDQAVRLKWSLAVERALLVAVEYFDTPVPAPVFQRLRQDRLPGEPAELVAGLASPGYHWQKARQLMLRLPLREQLQVAFKIVFPPTSYLRARYDLDPADPVWPYYGYRWMQQGQEVWRALWSGVRHKARLIA